MNQPFLITTGEWREIYEVPEVRELWGISVDEPDLDHFIAQCYGARFEFDEATYTGPLYVIHDDAFGGPPVVLTREYGKLRLLRHGD